MPGLLGQLGEKDAQQQGAMRGGKPSAKDHAQTLEWDTSYSFPRDNRFSISRDQFWRGKQWYGANGSAGAPLNVPLDTDQPSHGRPRPKRIDGGPDDDCDLTHNFAVGKVMLLLPDLNPYLRDELPTLPGHRSQFG